MWTIVKLSSTFILILLSKNTKIRTKIAKTRLKMKLWKLVWLSVQPFPCSVSDSLGRSYLTSSCNAYVACLQPWCWAVWALLEDFLPTWDGSRTKKYSTRHEHGHNNKSRRTVESFMSLLQKIEEVGWCCT